MSEVKICVTLFVCDSGMDRCTVSCEIQMKENGENTTFFQSNLERHKAVHVPPLNSEVKLNERAVKLLFCPAQTRGGANY